MAENFPELVIRSFADLADAFRAIQNHRQISNETLETIAGVCPGFADKYLGPRREKNIGPRTLPLILGALGIRLRVEVDPEQAQLVAGRWQRRNTKQVRVQPANPFTKEQLEHAKQIIFSEFGRKGALATLASRTPEEWSRFARKGWRTRRQARRRNGNGVNGRHNGHAAER